MMSSVRLDKWLWFARFAKTRADAQKLITRGQVTMNGHVAHKASASVRRGDAVVIILGHSRHTVTVAALGTRRGPAAEARTLYQRAAPIEHLGFEDAALPLYRRVSKFGA